MPKRGKEQTEFLNAIGRMKLQAIPRFMSLAGEDAIDIDRVQSCLKEVSDFLHNKLLLTNGEVVVACQFILMGKVMSMAEMWDSTSRGKKFFEVIRMLDDQ